MSLKSDVINKRLDSSIPAYVRKNSGVTRYWIEKQFVELYKNFRPGFDKVLPVSERPWNQEQFIRRFKLKGIEYGNWLSQEDRYNYLMSTVIAVYDLNRLLNFGHNIGLDKTVGIAFGARGRGGALAHFEPDTYMINLTRYHRADKMTDITGKKMFGNKTTGEVKDILIQKTGGVGSLAHEYGHALDYFFGTFIERDDVLKKYSSLTCGNSTKNNVPIWSVGSMRHTACSIIYKLMYDDNGKYTAYYKKMIDSVDSGEITEYWIRHNEMFARAFEVYISHLMREKGFTNTFLSKKKYEKKMWPYPQGTIFGRVKPLFDKLIQQMAKIANK